MSLLVIFCFFVLCTIFFSVLVYKREHCLCTPTNRAASNTGCCLDWDHSASVLTLPVSSYERLMGWAGRSWLRYLEGQGRVLRLHSCPQLPQTDVGSLAHQKCKPITWQSNPLTGNSGDRAPFPSSEGQVSEGHSPCPEAKTSCRKLQRNTATVLTSLCTSCLATTTDIFGWRERIPILSSTGQSSGILLNFL